MKGWLKMENLECKTFKNRWLILLVVVMMTFMACLDGSIINVALPEMSKNFQRIWLQYSGL